MCQLTYFNIQNLSIEDTKILVNEILKVNTFIKHKDGFGVSQGFTYFKIAEEPALADFSFLNKYIIDDSPIILHVRLASANKKNITSKDNHPFINKDILLAHNGTLKLKEGQMPKGKTDSEFFLECVQKERGTTLEKIKKVMENFEGKFAFLVREKEGNDYIIRGTSATLYISRLKVEGEDWGFIVNTEKESLFWIMSFIKSYIQIKLNTDNVEFTLPDLLEKDTVYLVERTNLKKVDSIKENIPEVKTYVWKSPVYGNVSKVSKLADSIIKVMSELDIYWDDLDILTLFFINKTFLEISDEDELFMFLDIISQLESSKEKSKLFRKILEDKKKEKVYESIEFPYFLNSEEKLKGEVK